MRTLLLALPLLAACGHHAEAHGPFHDIAGHYTATCSSSTGSYVGVVNVGDTRAASVNDAGLLSTTDSGGSPIAYRLNRMANGSFTSQARTVSTTTYEVLDANASVTSVVVTLVQSTPPATLGTCSYTVVKNSGG